MFDDKGIFIFGCPRSGTTLLRMILDSHPNMCAGEETGFLHEFENLVTHRWHQLKHFGLDKHEVLHMIRSFYLRFQHNFCQLKKKSIWVDKTPDYYNNFHFIFSLFPNAKIIFMIRDGRDVAASCKEKWGKQGFRKCVIEWNKSIRRSAEIKNEVGQNFYQLKYEDLINNTESELKKLFDFLEINWEEKILNHHEYEHSTSDQFGYERPLEPIFKSGVKSWKNRLTVIEKIVLNNSSKTFLKKMNYIKQNKRTYPALEKITRKLVFINYQFHIFLNRISNRKTVS